MKMQIVHGTGVYPAVAMGRLSFLETDPVKTANTEQGTPETEWARVVAAMERATHDLTRLQTETTALLGGTHAAIFEVHAMMLADPDYSAYIHTRIDAGVSAPDAVLETADYFAELFAQMEDSYMQARAADVRDVSARLFDILTDRKAAAPITTPTILAADDLTPSRTVSLAGAPILAFVTARGSRNSHTAILARAMQIPAVVALGGFPQDCAGEFVIVDGETGEVIFAPDEATITHYTEKQNAQQQAREAQAALIGLPNITRDGRCVELFANIGGVADIAAAKACDAGGIGLFRSEFLYLENERLPDEEMQYAAYRTVLSELYPKRVIVRTLDLGADKQLPALSMPLEENPALGVRALRFCLAHPEIFRVQLRALLRASAHGNLSIMFPMVTTVAELQEARALLDEERAALLAEGVAVSAEIPVGIMIETPAAALLAETLAPLVDFFSIGTNDLTQYTLAADRQNPEMETFFDGHHPAVMRLIRETVEVAHRHQKWVGICGEIAGDETLTAWFLDLGVSELSVAPGYILPLRAKIRAMDKKE